MKTPKEAIELLDQYDSNASEACASIRTDTEEGKKIFNENLTTVNSLSGTLYFLGKEASSKKPYKKLLKELDEYEEALIKASPFVCFRDKFPRATLAVGLTYLKDHPEEAPKEKAYRLILKDIIHR